MVDKKKILILSDSFCDLDLEQVKRSIDMDEELSASLELGGMSYSDFSVILFDSYYWVRTGVLEDKLKELIESKVKLICFCSYFKDLALEDIKKAIGYAPENLGWLEMPESGKHIRLTIKQMVAG